MYCVNVYDGCVNIVNESAYDRVIGVAVLAFEKNNTAPFLFLVPYYRLVVPFPLLLLSAFLSAVILLFVRLRVFLVYCFHWSSLFTFCIPACCLCRCLDGFAFGILFSLALLLHCFLYAVLLYCSLFGWLLVYSFHCSFLCVRLPSIFLSAFSVCCSVGFWFDLFFSLVPSSASAFWVFLPDLAFLLFVW